MTIKVSPYLAELQLNILSYPTHLIERFITIPETPFCTGQVTGVVERSSEQERREIFCFNDYFIKVIY